MKEKVKNRDPAIELARIIGCCIVIGVHTLLGYEGSESWDKSRLFIAMFFADGVGVFWLVSGAFIFNNKNYIKLIKKILVSIVLPMIIMSLIYYYFRDYICGNASFADSIRHSKEDYWTIIQSLLRWRNGIEGLGHFWYLYVYLFLILFYPVLKAFVDYLNANNKRIIIFLCISFFLLILNDITNNELLCFSHQVSGGLIPASIMSIWGHIIYNNKEKIKKSYTFPVILIFVLLNILRLFIQLFRVERGINNKQIMFWYSSIGLLCALSILFFCICVINLKCNVINGVICFVASNTFYIYMIHILVRDFFTRYKVQDRLFKISCEKNDGIMGELVYSFLIVACIFCFSMLIIIFVKYVSKYVCVGFTKCRNLFMK